MPGQFPDSIQRKIEDRLRFYDDLGIRLFYRDRAGTSVLVDSIASSAVTRMEEVVVEEKELPKSASKSVESKPAAAKFTAPTPIAPKAAPSPVAMQMKEIFVKPAAPLFDTVDKVQGDTLLKIREDLGECTRCKLHKTRNKIVFGDGSSKARLVFVGEGPGADEDEQGLPFVGRAGKLLTQMIEAGMGLQRKDVYICNVVKCRPPGNRAPEPDEVTPCSPFLLRQIDALNPKVIVCLGAVAAKTLLNTTKGISQFRGQWLEWRGYKLMATYHPAYLLRNPPAKSEVWKDLQMVMVELGLELPRKNKSS
jgi:uracil-DNA glycosylase family 4